MDEKILIQDLAEQLAKAEGLQKVEALAFVRAFFDTVIKGLGNDKYVKIKGFGTFKLVEVDSRESVNVNTGERFLIDGHSKITFSPDNALKEQVNKPFAHFETVVLSDEVTDGVLDEVDRKFDEGQPEKAELTESEKDANDNAVLTIEHENVELCATTFIPEDDPFFVRLANPFSPEKVQPEVESEQDTEPVQVEEPVQAEEPDQTVEQMEETEQEEVPEPQQVVKLEQEKQQVIESYQENNSAQEAETEQAEEESVSVESVPDNIETIESETVPLSSVPTGLISAPTELIEPSVSPTQKPSKGKLWVLWLIFCIVAAMGGYVLGYFQIFAPKVDNLPTIVHDTVYRQKIVHDTIEVEKVALPQQAAITAAQIVKRGVYEIAGTKETHILQQGETLRIIAERYYGSRELAPYIVVYNNIADANLVSVGTVLKIPELKRKSE